MRDPTMKEGQEEPARSKNLQQEISRWDRHQPHLDVPSIIWTAGTRTLVNHCSPNTVALVNLTKKKSPIGSPVASSK